MSEKYKTRNPEGIYFATATVIDWIDIFTRNDYREIIIDSLRFCQEKKSLNIHAWCLMSNHLHFIISSVTHQPLSATLGDFKKHTSKTIVNHITQIPESRSEWMLQRFKYAGKYRANIKGHKFWQDGNHPIVLDSNDMIEQKLEYIHMNPVRAKIVAEPHHYLYSSAIDYAGGKGLLDISLLD